MRSKLLAALLLAWLCAVWWFPGEHSLRYTDSDHELAQIIAGETPGCPWEAKLAVGHVHSRNEVWFGRRNPTTDDALAALVWRHISDPGAGAVYMIMPTDRAKMPWLSARIKRWQCAHGPVEVWR